MNNSVFENGIYRILLPESISATNIDGFQAEISDLTIPEGTKEIILDASKMKYISSVGLRLIQSLVKKYKDIPITVDNTSPEVYEIFDMTGFTLMMKVERAIRYIDIKNLEELGRGMYGSVYRVDDETIAKVFHGVNSMEGIKRVLDNVRVAFGKGIPTIIPFDTVKTDYGYGMVFELLSSKSMADLIHEEPGEIDHYARLMTDLAKTLAETKFEKGFLGRRKEMLRAELESAAFLFTEEENRELLRYLDAVPDSDTAVHGDFHARNIYIFDGKPILIDMDDFCKGHPIWDIACLYRVYPWLIGLDNETARDLFDLDENVPYEDFYYQIMHVSFEEGSRLWKLFFNFYFDGYSEEEKDGFLKTAQFYSDFMIIRFIIDQCRKVKDDPEALAGKLKLIRKLLSGMRAVDLENLIRSLEHWRLKTDEEQN